MYKPIQVESIERVSENGTRFYKTPSGNKYPSVTSVFSVLDNSYIDEWKKRVGEKEAARVSNRAAGRGTWIHEQCEYLLKDIPQPPVDPVSSMLYSEMWQSFKPIIEKIGDTHAIETQLYSDYLECAGTVDCIGYWDGKLSVIDFKTSGRVKHHDEIDSYWMQTSAYAIMWEERTRMPVSQLVILMAVDDSEPLVFVDKRKNWQQKFIDIRKSFKEQTGI
jgi:genome maintenance exonuclease 1